MGSNGIHDEKSGSWVCLNMGYSNGNFNKENHDEPSNLAVPYFQTKNDKPNKRECQEGQHPY